MKKRKINIIFQFLFMFFFSLLIISKEPAYSQNFPTDSTSKKNIDSTSVRDTSKFKKLDAIVLNKPIDDKKFVMKKSTWGALIRSFILPGWGQLYVESYWKAPFAFLGSGLFAYLYIDYNKKYQNDANLYSALQKNNLKSVSLDSLKQWKEYYRDTRDMDAFYFFVVYAISAIDAYVGAHLYDYNVNENLSLGIVPNNFRGVSLRISIKK